MRAFILSLVIAIGTAYAADPIDASLVVLPAKDFPEMQPFKAKAVQIAALTDGRQVFQLANGMRFVSVAEEKFPASVSAGVVVLVREMLTDSRDPDRFLYLISAGEGKGRPQCPVYRFR